MSYYEQQQFCRDVKARFPAHFKGGRVLDIGSQDINGTNRGLFEGSDYTGVDLDHTRNVDVVCRAHLLPYRPGTFDCVISTEALEHDQWWELTLRKSVELLRPGGLYVMTCAAPSRPEHGTSKHSPTDSPMTAHYYRGLGVEDVEAVLRPMTCFEQHEIRVRGNDLQAWGVKA